MRPVGILPALLSAAALVCASATQILTLPKSVNFRVGILEGIQFKAIPDYQTIRDDVFAMATEMFKIFTDSYNTTFRYTPLVLNEWDDGSISFNSLKTKSNQSQTENINLYVYFASNLEYRGGFRTRGLEGKMCNADKGFSTLLLNQVDWKGRKQDATNLARMLVYYTSCLLGMREDAGSCPRGFMHFHNWRSSDTKLHTWSVCNVRQLHKFYLKYEECWGEIMCASGGKVNEFTSVIDVPTLRISLAALSTREFSKIGGIQAIVQKAEEYLNRGNSVLGANFKLEIPKVRGLDVIATDAFAADTGNITNTLENAKNALEETLANIDQKFFLFFTDQGLEDLPQQAHADMSNKFCDDDIKYRTLIFDRKDWGGSTGQFSEDGVAKQLVYYIGHSIGLTYDLNRRGCHDGFMAARNIKGAGGTRKKWIAFWNRNSTNIRWNRCNTAEMLEKMKSNQCLKDSLKWE